MDATREQRDTANGLLAAAGAFALWGVMPLYWYLLKAVPSLQIVLHRVVWSAVLVCGWLLLSRGTRWLGVLRGQPRLAGMLALSSLLIGFNWGLYIWAVNAGHVVETALGYFILPVFNVVTGVLLLRERLTAAQWVSVAIAVIGVLWLTFSYGSFPWIALALAASFALYGLIRKLTPVDSITGLGIESAYLFLPGLALLLWSESHGNGGFGSGYGLWLSLWLVCAGALTALPLAGFAYAVRRIPLSTVGLLQYIAPTLQFLIGVLVLREPFDRDRAIGFVFIWVALAIFSADSLHRARRARRMSTGAST